MNNPEKKQVLNAGCGVAGAERVASVFPPALWNEVRLDIEPEMQPDILGSFADMRGMVADACFDALYSSHSIEHLYAHEVIPAFREFLRVLKPDGFALVTCPDLAAIARQLLDGGDEGIAYQSPAGPIRPIDMLFGHSQSIAAGHVAMAHNTGFTAARLGRVALASGFAEVRLIEGANFDLWALLLGPLASLEKIAPLITGPEIAGLVAATGRSTSEAGAAERRV
jgi:SAM-dependent methyltransferase